MEDVMNYRQLMVTGALCGAAITITAFFANVPVLSVMAFACGAVFGKGYGHWEADIGNPISENKDQ